MKQHPITAGISRRGHAAGGELARFGIDAALSQAVHALMRRSASLQPASGDLAGRALASVIDAIVPTGSVASASAAKGAPALSGAKRVVPLLAGPHQSLPASVSAPVRAPPATQAF